MRKPAELLVVVVVEVSVVVVVVVVVGVGVGVDVVVAVITRLHMAYSGLVTHVPEPRHKGIRQGLAQTQRNELGFRVWGLGFRARRCHSIHSNPARVI